MSADALPLLATKLHAPPARANGVARPRLTARLAEGRPFTLISAPAARPALPTLEDAYLGLVLRRTPDSV